MTGENTRRGTLRMLTRSKSLLISFIISLIWSISLFITPTLVPPGTVTDLDGSANRVDFSETWDSMPLYPRAMYYLGDTQCHQKWYRSFMINGNQMPVDARVTAIYLGLTMGLSTAMFARRTPYPLVNFASILPSRLRRIVKEKIGHVPFFFLFSGALAAPLVIDGVYQLISTYESTNLLRVLTGLPFGWVSGLLVGVLILSIGGVRRQNEISD
jgi:uncharacterized membrane protein